MLTAAAAVYCLIITISSLISDDLFQQDGVKHNNQQHILARIIFVAI